MGAFLTRCLFSMFAEDVGLLPQTGPDGQGSFIHLLHTHREQPATLVQMLKALWQGMDVGGFNFMTLLVAFLGACLLLFLLGLVKRRA